MTIYQKSNKMGEKQAVNIVVSNINIYMFYIYCVLHFMDSDFELYCPL